ncbi:MAG TPA: class I SAM-dependent methyltransferase [Acidimicrobiia bacterium]
MKRLLERLIRRIARVFAEEVRRELESSEGIKTRGRAQIDVVDALRELASGPANQELQRVFFWNHRWIAMLSERNQRAATETWDFIDQLDSPLFVLEQFRVIESRKDEILEFNGHVLDLGVYKGASTRALARMFPDHTIHGFDSFEGLPEDWAHVVRGSFGEIEGALPDVPSNVILHKGWFDETLGPWAKEHDDQPIMLMRVDCDIYSSAKTIFTEFGGLIRPGTWILFDELIGYRGWRQHEFKAFQEFLEDTGFQVDWVAHGLTYFLVRLRAGNPS